MVKYECLVETGLRFGRNIGTGDQIALERPPGASRPKQNGRRASRASQKVRSPAASHGSSLLAERGLLACGPEGVSAAKLVEEHGHDEHVEDR
jgi:hypothetical protein